MPSWRSLPTTPRRPASHGRGNAASPPSQRRRVRSAAGAAFEAQVDAFLCAAGVEAVALAGYMRLLSADFVSRRRGRILNIHPSLLPKYKGLDTHARALARRRCRRRLFGPPRHRGARRRPRAWPMRGRHPARRYARGAGGAGPDRRAPAVPARPERVSRRDDRSARSYPRGRARPSRNRGTGEPRPADVLRRRQVLRRRSATIIMAMAGTSCACAPAGATSRRCCWRPHPRPTAGPLTWAPRGWVGIDLAGQPDWPLIEDRIARSWELAAPARLLEAGGR